MEQQIREVLGKNGYSEVEFNYRNGNQFFFEGHTDAFQQIRVDVNEEKKQMSVYDRYIEDKHYVYYGNFDVQN